MKNMKRLFVVWIVTMSFLSGCNSKTSTDFQRDLGFHLGTPYYTIGGIGTEVMDVSFVQPNGVFAKAGFKAGDIFLDWRSNNSINELFAFLEASRGKTITLRVVPSGSGRPLAQRPVKNITFQVPQSAQP